MAINKTGAAHWEGGIKDGKGTISTETKALDAYPFGFASRFEGKPGSNPEELIGAAEMLSVAPFARACPDPVPHLRDLRNVLETVAGRTAAALVATLDDLLGRAARVPQQL